MGFHTILAAYDKSEVAARAVTQALDLASEIPGCRVYIVLVLPDFRTALGYGGLGKGTLLSASAGMFDEASVRALEESAIRREKDEIDRLIGDSIKQSAAATSIEVVYNLKPAIGILEFAEKHECDLIVMGAHGLNPLGGLLGSASYAVLHSPSVPVMVVK
jgi:nucleotide-binding universal stress UspA family protein